MRRTQLIAHTFACSPLRAVTLILAEAREASALAMPVGGDCLALPGLVAEKEGKFKARYLDVPLEEVLALWRRVIRVAVEVFEPDVLIADIAPRGAERELDPTLEYLRARGRTRCVLGLRDVLGDPAHVRDRWRHYENEEAIRDFYDAVWVYGDPTVYDLVQEIPFPREVAAKVRYTGYLDQRARLTFPELEDAEPLEELELLPGRLVLCLVGGGEDGADLAEAFAQADLPADTHGVIVTGPFMPREVRQRLRARAARQPRLRVLGFASEPTRLLGRADRIIAMGGYNTVCEVLSFEKRALIVPRLGLSREQWIRAERLQEMGLLDVLHPDAVNPAALTAWLAREMGPAGRGGGAPTRSADRHPGADRPLAPPPRAHSRIDLNGLARLPDLLGEVLAGLSEEDRVRGGFQHVNR